MTLDAVKGQVDDDPGFTLVELLVAMSILLVVSTVVVSGIVSGLRASQRGQARVEALTDLERAAQRMARDLRFADPVVQATSDLVAIDVLRDNAGVLVRHEIIYMVAGGVITEDRAIYSIADPAVLLSDPPARAVVDGLGPGTVFRFYKADSTERDGTASPPDPLSSIAEIRIDLRRDLPAQDPIELETAVFIRNADDGR